MKNEEWANNKIFEGLSTDQLQFVKSHLYETSYKSGETIMKSGEQGDFAFFITDGSVEVFADELKLTEFREGELVGLMALIDDEPRSATVVAGAHGVQGNVINSDDWKNLMNNGHTDIKSTILSNYIKYQQKSFRNTTQLSLAEARARIDQEKRRVVSAHFFAQMVLGLIVFVFLLGNLTEMARQVESTFISVGLLFAYAVWSYLYIRFSHFDLKTFGITMTNFKPALKLSLKMTLVFVVMLFVLKWILITFWPDDFGDKLIDFQLLDQNGQSYAVLVIGVYSFPAILQEFIARSCIQGGLMEFITGKWAEWKSIILATLMFSSFHIMIDIKYGFLTIAPGMLWGYLFYKNRNLLAVSISHIIIGIVALFMLNLMG